MEMKNQWDCYFGGGLAKYILLIHLCFVYSILVICKHICPLSIIVALASGQDWTRKTKA